jgi:hypothetical protein
MLWLCLALTTTLPTLPRGMAPPKDGRAAAQARVNAVYDAIDRATDDLEMRAELRRRCKIESWCNWYRVKAVHQGDSSLGRKRWRRAVDRGLLDPDSCPEHELGETRDEWAWWSTVGSFGNVSSYVVRFEGKCVHPREMADPKVAARLAVAHAKLLCRRHKACSCPARARWWAGPGRWDRWWPSKRLARTERVCGPQGWSDWLVMPFQTIAEAPAHGLRALKAAIATLDLSWSTPATPPQSS